MRQVVENIDPSAVRNVTCIGAGPIGAGWAAHFLARGYQVTAYVHDPGEEAPLRALIDDAWITLDELGLEDGASTANLRCTNDLDDAVSKAEFVQECAPEDLELKQTLFARLDGLTAKNMVIASSTSGLSMTEIQARCENPQRTLVGHPFNPPYLLPLVEVVGGSKTAPEAVQWAVEFYRFAGKAPLALSREIPGFIATRLQEAIWREALHMVANGEATVEEIDFAVVNGPGPRWALMGPCLTFHLGGGAGGMAYNLDQFGPTLKLPWSRMQAPELTPQLRERLVDGCRRAAAGRDYSTLNRERDSGLIAIQKALKARGDPDDR